MLRGPTVANVTVQVACPVVGSTGWAVHDANATAPFENDTVPASGVGLTVAVKVTGTPAEAGVDEGTSAVVVELPWLMVCVSDDRLVWKSPLPVNEAPIGCTPITE